MFKNTVSPQYELEMINLEKLEPKDNPIRKVTKAIDFEFIRDEVTHLYYQDNRCPAINPVRLLKIMLLSYACYRGLSKMQMQCFLAALAQKIKKIALLVWAFLFGLWMKLCSSGAFAKDLGKMTAYKVI